MSNTIKIKNSANSTSTPSSLEHGELGLNYADGRLFYKNSSNQIVYFSKDPGPLSGLSDTTITLPVAGDFLQWNGTAWINQDDGLIPAGGVEGQIIAKVTDANHDIQWIDNYTGDLRIIAKNDSGVTISKGQAVMAVGAVGDRIEIAKAVADGSVSSKYMLGLASQDILDSEEGYVQMLGEIRNLNTSAYAIGTILYINPASVGGLTSTKPTAPNLAESVAIVTRSHASTGILFVRMWSQGESISELHDVAIDTLTSGQFLKWNGTVWVNDTIDLGGGAEVSDSPPLDPSPGNLWYESDTGKMFIYYDSFWVEIIGSVGPAGPEGPEGPSGGGTVVTTTISSASTTAISSFSASTHRTAEYIVQVTQGSKYTSSKVFVVHNGTTATMTEFAVVELSATTRIPLTISATLSAGTVNIYATITDAGTTSATVKVAETLIEV